MNTTIVCIAVDEQVGSTLALAEVDRVEPTIGANAMTAIVRPIRIDMGR
ncbi:MAG: hypothetical protein KGJ92_03160 [Actinomycetales bacterium]|nr:hypothetical protein [Actinomycetales bacterium]